MNIEFFDRVSLTCKNFIENSDEYISSIAKIDQNLSAAMYSNEYVNNVGEMSEFLLDELFGKDLSDHLKWYLYTWEPGFSIKSPGNKEYIIDCHDDYINCTKELFEEHFR